MEFRTELKITPCQHSLSYAHKIMMIGSCFTENIGNWLKSHYMPVLVNPFGIVYNPMSVARCLENLQTEKTYTPEDLFFDQGEYHSFDHHSRFSGSDLSAVLEYMNQQRILGSNYLTECTDLFITFGTAWVYSLTDTQDIVSNCHKLPAKTFTRSRLEVADIVSTWSKILKTLFKNNPHLQVHFTVSPIRHIKDTLHGNQLSKSILLLAVETLVEQFNQVHYFPAYELLLDDLRDYRFYADDLVHPSSLAIEYIQEKFAERYFDKDTKNLFLACDKITKAINHRPSDINSPAYRLFLEQNIEKVQAIINKNPYFSLQEPLNQLQERLNDLSNRNSDEISD